MHVCIFYRVGNVTYKNAGKRSRHFPAPESIWIGIFQRVSESESSGEYLNRNLPESIWIGFFRRVSESESSGEYLNRNLPESIWIGFFRRVSESESSGEYLNRNRPESIWIGIFRRVSESESSGEYPNRNLPESIWIGIFRRVSESDSSGEYLNRNLTVLLRIPHTLSMGLWQPGDVHLLISLSENAYWLRVSHSNIRTMYSAQFIRDQLANQFTWPVYDDQWKVFDCIRI